MNKFWQVHWVTRQHAAKASDHPVLRKWADLDVREEAARIDPGDVFYTTRSAFAHLARETRRNYAGDCCLFFNFLWQRSKNWCDAEVEDLLDFEDWRRWSPRNPRRIGGSKWDRELSALARLYKWAAAKRYVAANPVVMREVLGRHGEMVSVPAQRARDARSSNVKWLTPQAYRLWRDVGLRGYTADGRRDPAFRGRNDDRNAAYSDLLFSSGMRLSEGGSLLTFEVPALEESVKRFFDGRLAKAATKSRRERTFYVAVEDLRSVAPYERTTRRAVIRRAQAGASTRRGTTSGSWRSGPVGSGRSCTCGTRTDSRSSGLCRRWMSRTVSACSSRGTAVWSRCGCGCRRTGARFSRIRGRRSTGRLPGAAARCWRARLPSRPTSHPIWPGIPSR